MKPILLITLLLTIVPAYCPADPIEIPKLIAQDVQCRGNHRISCNFIRSQVHVKQGDVLNEEEIVNAELRLSSLRNFESVSVHLEKGSERGAAIVVVEVIEADPIATEFLVGTSARLESVRGVFAGRIANQNVFGAGKIVDATVLAVTPLGGDAIWEEYNVMLRYADPNLFGWSKYFAVASAGWQTDRRRDIHGNFSELEAFQFDLRFGRRFGDFSYFTLGFIFSPDQGYTFGRWRQDGSFAVVNRNEFLGLTLIYGWNSEDDLYFPTRGSSFHIGAGREFGSGSPENRSHLQFRKTWSVTDGFLALKIGGGPSPEYRTSFEESQLVALSYSRGLQNSETFSRGRWYVEPGFSWNDRNPQGELIYEIGLKAGVRLHMTGWGIVDLYLMASTDAS